MSSSTYAPGPAAISAEFSGEARLVSRTALAVEITARVSAPAYLVLTDSYHPEWTVAVNDKPAGLARANQIFRAVALPEGESLVVFRYRPASLYWGAAVTAGTVLLALFFALARGRPERPGYQPNPTDYH